MYPTLTLEQVYAAITYYLHNKAEVDDYIRRGEVIAEAYYQEYLQQEPYASSEGACSASCPTAQEQRARDAAMSNPSSC